MNFLDIHPRYRPLASVLICAICLAPIALDLNAKQTAKQDAEQAISQTNDRSARDERIALDRAQRCILIDEKFPMVEGGSAYYNPRSRNDKRLLPANTALCSAQSGYTAIVDRTGGVSDIKQAPIEKITQVLKQRGVIR